MTENESHQRVDDLESLLALVEPDLRDRHEETFDSRTGEFYCDRDEEDWPCRVIVLLDSLAASSLSVGVEKT